MTPLKDCHQGCSSIDRKTFKAVIPLQNNQMQQRALGQVKGANIFIVASDCLNCNLLLIISLVDICVRRHTHRAIRMILKTKKSKVNHKMKYNKAGLLTSLKAHKISMVTIPHWQQAPPSSVKLINSIR